MKVKLVVLAAILFSPVGSMAATVEYQHPEVTIVAVNESLDSVLTALGKEMKLNVTTPTGINPTINCDIRNQPIELAFKKLLGDLSYSLVWADGGEQLTGLVILAGDGVAGETAVAERQSSAASHAQIIAGVSDSGQSTSASPAPFDDDAKMAEHEAQMAIEQQHEAETEEMQEEQEIADQAKMTDERARREAAAEAYIESRGFLLPE